MLLDEPVQSLDAAGALSIMHLLRAEAAAGKAVIVVMHELNLAQQFCDALVVMQNGTVAFRVTHNTSCRPTAFGLSSALSSSSLPAAIWWRKMCSMMKPLRRPDGASGG